MRGRESWNGLFFFSSFLVLGFRVGVGSSDWFLGGNCRILFFVFVCLCVDHSLVGRPVFFFPSLLSSS